MNMQSERFGRTMLDLTFRRTVASAITAAKREILVVTGEFSAFSSYIELQWAVKAALERGVRVKVYANRLPPGTAAKLLRWGCTVHIGRERARDHFMLIDGEKAVVSRRHPPARSGSRHGYATTEDLGQMRLRYRELALSGTRLRSETRPDPMDAFLAAPPFEVLKDARKQVDEAVARA
jgi:hypothetical protein